MQHMIAQHGSHNRKYRRNLLRKCELGSSVLYSDHPRKVISENNCSELRRKSSKRFEKKYGKDVEGRDTSKHRDWADEFNFGVEHFDGLLVKINNLFFDTLHANLSRTRRILTFSEIL